MLEGAAIEADAAIVRIASGARRRVEAGVVVGGAGCATAVSPRRSSRASAVSCVDGDAA
jgi:hypothetical protein